MGVMAVARPLARVSPSEWYRNNGKRECWFWYDYVTVNSLLFILGHCQYLGLPIHGLSFAQGLRIQASLVFCSDSFRGFLSRSLLSNFDLATGGQQQKHPTPFMPPQAEA